MPARERLRELAEDLRSEVAALDRVVDEARRCLGDLASREPTYLELRGAGDIVHDFYNAIERFMERVAVEMNGGLPAGPESHTTLLARMARDLPGVRPAVLRPETRRRLDEYLRFRHLFRHRYGFELEWARLQPLLRGIDDLAARLRGEMEAFVDEVVALSERLG